MSRYVTQYLATGGVDGTDNMPVIQFGDVLHRASTFNFRHRNKLAMDLSPGVLQSTGTCPDSVNSPEATCYRKGQEWKVNDQADFR